jgi:hypothetical protein
MSKQLDQVRPARHAQPFVALGVPAQRVGASLARLAAANRAGRAPSHVEHTRLVFADVEPEGGTASSRWGPITIRQARAAR